jgi:hypothetical protein
VFVEPAAGWSGSHGQKAKLTASDGRAQDALGATVAINGNLIVAGAQKRNNDTGLAYVFVEPASGWKNMTQTGELSATGLAIGDFFGNGVAVSPTKIAIGSATTFTTGTAYAYTEPATGWKSMLATSEATVTGGNTAARLRLAVQFWQPERPPTASRMFLDRRGPFQVP